jgi:hypothetical protein
MTKVPMVAAYLNLPAALLGYKFKDLCHRDMNGALVHYVISLAKAYAPFVVSSIVGRVVCDGFTESSVMGKIAGLAVCFIPFLAAPAISNRLSQEEIYRKHGEVFQDFAGPLFYRERELYYLYWAKRLRMDGTTPQQELLAMVYENLAESPIQSSGFPIDIQDDISLRVMQCAEKLTGNSVLDLNRCTQTILRHYFTSRKRLANS